MAWSVDDEEAWQFEVKLFATLHVCNVPLQVLLREVSGTDLLSDTTGFIGLHIRLSQLIQDEGLTCVDVTHDANDWTAKLSSIFRLLSFLSRLQKCQLSCSTLLGIRAALSIV